MYYYFISTRIDIKSTHKLPYCTVQSVYAFKSTHIRATENYLKVRLLLYIAMDNTAENGKGNIVYDGMLQFSKPESYFMEERNECYKPTNIKLTVTCLVCISLEARLCVDKILLKSCYTKCLND